MTRLPLPLLKRASSLCAEQFDSLVVIYGKYAQLQSALQATAAPLNETNLIAEIDKIAAIDAAFEDSVHVMPMQGVSGNKLILCSTGSLDEDTDDVRKFSDAAATAVHRARKSGSINPLLYVPPPVTMYPERMKNYLPVALLGALSATYLPLQRRELYPDSVFVASMGVFADTNEISESLLAKVAAIEAGRRVARDIGGSDPERTRPEKCVEYLQGIFGEGGNVEMGVVEGKELDEYPLLRAVSRASLAVPRHHPKLIRLKYLSHDQSKVTKNLFFVGKGITYDTGGADVKAGGHMRGMSRDKIGAAAVAGFVYTASLLQDPTVNIYADLSFVRNSIGADSYVSDEVIVSRAGVKVTVGNTDAEGRMVMADPLCYMKELVRDMRAADDKTPCHIFTVATLTGHVIRAYGTYGAAMSNGPARAAGIPQMLVEQGNLWADPFEDSVVRREDFAFGKPDPEGTSDIIQCNSAPSTMTARGHQFPAAFMTIASGLDKYGLSQTDPDLRISYTHLDIAGSAEEGSAVGFDLPKVTGSPVSVLTAALLSD